MIAQSGIIDLWSLSMHRGAPVGGPAGMAKDPYSVALIAGQDDSAVAHLSCPEMPYQDASDTWHRSDRWPQESTPATLRLSRGDRLVAKAAAVEPGDASFRSAKTDPGSDARAASPRAPRAWPELCGHVRTHSVLYVSAPLASDVLLAGNIKVDLTISSFEPGANFAVFLWKTTGDGSCPYRNGSAFGRAMLDLRH